MKSVEDGVMVYSIFTSINGEVCNAGQGSLATFIRFAGCNLRCKWCDTSYALEPESGSLMMVDEILSICRDYGLKNVTITGGEPLMQSKGFILLVEALYIARYDISVETNGSIKLPWVNAWVNAVVHWVYDIKPPSAGVGRVHPHPNSKEFKRFKEDDWIKFVVSNREDYDEAKKYYRGLKEAYCRARYAFSPMSNTLDTKELVEWMKQDKLSDVLVNVQLHKIIDLSESK
jgi:7-carboxy-7-deazaguanine synthase